MDVKEVINRIFKDTKTKYELTEFDNLGRPIEEILEIHPKVQLELGNLVRESI